MIRNVSTGRVKLDSVKVKIPSDSFTILAPDAFFTALRLDKGATVSERLQAKPEALRGPQAVGLKSIEIGQDETTIELSAKVLKGDYYDLITARNIERAIAEVNGAGLIELDSNRFLDTAEVLRCDTTGNLHVSGDVSDYLASLKVYGRLHPKYEVKPYNTTGVVFRRNVSSYKERLIFYDKFTEIMRDKQRDVLLPDRFQNVLRVEGGHTDFKRIRERFKVSERRLLVEVLQSQQNVNLQLFRRIVDSPDVQQARAKFDALRSYGGRLRDIEKRKGMEGIIEACNYDMELVRAFLKSTVRGNLSGYFRRYSELLADMISRGEGGEESGASDYDTDLIGEIRELLKAA